MFNTVSVILLAAMALAAALHLLWFGPKRVPDDVAEAGPGTVARLSLTERLMHGVLALSFIVLAVTALGAEWSAGELGGWMLLIHVGAGSVFAVALALAALRWAGENVFAAHDRHWFSNGLGGYLRREDRQVAAGRFDAGQKLLFWTVLTLGAATMLTILLSVQPWFGYRGQAMLIEVHRYAGLLLVAAVVVHLYIMLVAKAGAWRSMFRPRVAAAWARHHHGLWWRHFNDKGDS